MNREIKQRWVEALRSGEFEQGTHRLRNRDNTYCCLGVLCELAVADGAAVRNDTYSINAGETAYAGVIENGAQGRYATALVPRDLLWWADLGQIDPTVTVDSELRALSSLNDSGATFEQIADIIEEQL